MKKLLIGLTLLGASLSASAQVANVVLDNCVLKQNTQTRTVEVSYELTGDTPVYVTVEITTNGVPIPNLVRIRGDVSTTQFPVIVEPDNSAPKKIYWDAQGDWPSNLTTEARATVTAWFTNNPPASVGTYAVIDLFDGPTAGSYPVRYSVAPPDLNDPGCKTTELWMRRIPAGTFTMGSPVGETGRVDARETQHQVTLTKDFYIGVFPVTQKQWERVMGTNPSDYKGDTRPVERLTYGAVRGAVADGVDWPNTGYTVKPGSFMDVLRKKTTLLFDLPTDAQWEYACRAGTTTALNNGMNLTNGVTDASMAEVGRYAGNTGDGKGGFTQHTVVGLYKPNAWGLYDMHGNVYEFCRDWLQENLGGGAVTDPTGPTSAQNGMRIVRGAGFAYEARQCRSSDRNNIPPDTPYNIAGFRACILLGN